MARQRDGRELGVMAVGDGSLLAVYVNFCMALKQLARSVLRGCFPYELTDVRPRCCVGDPSELEKFYNL
jgi:hypothetical protein